MEGTTGTRWTYTASGVITNTAALIAALADGGMIFLGPETARRVEPHFLIKEIGYRQLRNLADEMMIHRVLGARQA